MTTSDDIKLAYRVVFYIVVFGVLLMIITSVVRKCEDNFSEGWITYKRGPDNSIRTGIDGYYTNGVNSLGPSAPAFYLVPEYRLPYDWPRGFQTNYPINHVEPLVALN
jgi:hypothetical protein